MSARELFRCSKNFEHAGSDQAAELLLIQDPYSTAWDVKPRCDEHPAVDDIPLIRRISPALRCVNVPLDGAHE